MATDNEQLVLSISADTRQIQRQLKTLIGQTQRDTKVLADTFGVVDKASSAAFNDVAANSNRAFGVAVNGARQLDRAMAASRVQTSNLAAQFNDIGVQLAGGQSPFLIALQQGSQINQALGSGAGVRGAVSALAGAFTSLLNPVSLATIAIIGLGGSAIQYFTELLSSSEDVELSLEKQAELIQRVASRWGEAMPALKEYADELKRVEEASERSAAAEIPAKEQYEGLAEELRQLTPLFARVNRDLSGANVDPTFIRDFGNAFGDLRDRLEEGVATAEDVKSVQEALAGALDRVATPAVDDLAAAFANLAQQILGAIGQANRFRSEGVSIPPQSLPVLGTLTPLQSVDGKITGDAMAIQNARAEATKSQVQIEAEKEARRRGGGGRSSAISDAEREKKAVADLITQLEFEQSLIGATAQEREVANALRRAGSAATDEQRAKIEQLVEATYAEREALKANQEAMQELQSVAKDVLGGIVSDLRAGKSGADILANALDRVISKIAEGGIDQFVNAIFGGGIGGRGGALLGQTYTLDMRNHP